MDRHRRGHTHGHNHADQSRGQGVVHAAETVGQLTERARSCVSVGGIGQSLVCVRSESVVEDLTRIQTFANRCIRYLVSAKREVCFRQMREKHWRMTDLYDWIGVEMLEVYITRRTLRYLSSLAKYDNDSWEQTLKQEVKANGAEEN